MADLHPNLSSTVYIVLLKKKKRKEMSNTRDEWSIESVHGLTGTEKKKSVLLSWLRSVSVLLMDTCIRTPTLRRGLCIPSLLPFYSGE